MPAVKTAISLDEKLFREAEAAAKELSVSRSELFAIALREYLKRRRDDEITARLNEVYAEPPDEDELELMAALRANNWRMEQQRRLEERSGK